MTYTNASLRKLLGEAGYIESKKGVASSTEARVTIWRRGIDALWLIETRENQEPYLTEIGSTNRINPKMLGVRNPNIQTGNGR